MECEGCDSAKYAPGGERMEYNVGEAMYEPRRMYFPTPITANYQIR